ncbi:bacteriocin immunity protein [Pseudomonas sp. 18175]|uniref:bacteriocin immunity protein n=1 Tax=Pseudomonas sp. 18175 TaxID=3390056 RepID=UPI003D1ABD46
MTTAFSALLRLDILGRMQRETNNGTQAFFSEYTKPEFMAFITELFRENSSEKDDRIDELLEHFERVTEHPDGTDLIYYASDAESTVEAITQRVENWRSANGKSGFKTE